MSMENLVGEAYRSEGAIEHESVTLERALEQFDEVGFLAALERLAGALPPYNDAKESQKEFAARVVTELDSALRPFTIPQVQISDSKVVTDAIPYVTTTNNTHALGLVKLLQAMVGAVEASRYAESDGKRPSDLLQYDLGDTLGPAVGEAMNAIGKK